MAKIPYKNKKISLQSEDLQISKNVCVVQNDTFMYLVERYDTFTILFEL